MEDEIPFLIFAKRVAIHRTNLNGTDFDTIILNSSFTSNAIAIDFDIRYATNKLLLATRYSDYKRAMHDILYRQSELFWTDVRARVIVRSSLDGLNATLLVNSDLSGNSCHSIAVCRY